MPAATVSARAARPYPRHGLPDTDQQTPRPSAPPRPDPGIGQSRRPARQPGWSAGRCQENMLDEIALEEARPVDPACGLKRRPVRIRSRRPSGQSCRLLSAPGLQPDTLITDSLPLTATVDYPRVSLLIVHYRTHHIEAGSMVDDAPNSRD